LTGELVEFLFRELQDGILTGGRNLLSRWFTFLFFLCIQIFSILCGNFRIKAGFRV